MSKTTNVKLRALFLIVCGALPLAGLLFNVPLGVMCATLFVIAVVLTLTVTDSHVIWLLSPYPLLVFLSVVGYIVKPLCYYIYPEVSYEIYKTFDLPSMEAQIPFVIFLYGMSLLGCILAFRSGCRLLRTYVHNGTPHLSTRRHYILLGITVSLLFALVNILLRIVFRASIPMEQQTSSLPFVVGFLVRFCHYGRYVVGGTIVLLLAANRRRGYLALLVFLLLVPDVVDTIWGKKGPFAYTCVFGGMLCLFVGGYLRITIGYMKALGLCLAVLFVVALGYSYGGMRREGRLAGDVFEKAIPISLISPFIRVSGFESAVPVVDARKSQSLSGTFDDYLLHPEGITNPELYGIRPGKGSIAVTAIGQGYLMGGMPGSVILFAIGGFCLACVWVWSCSGNTFPLRSRCSALFASYLTLYTFLQEGGGIAMPVKDIIVIGAAYTLSQKLFFSRATTR